MLRGRTLSLSLSLSKRFLALRQMLASARGFYRLHPGQPYCSNEKAM